MYESPKWLSSLYESEISKTAQALEGRRAARRKNEAKNPSASSRLHQSPPSNQRSRFPAEGPRD